MGYSHRKEWSEQEMIDRIMELANTFDPVRMPSRAEFKEYYGDSSLTNKICRTGGHYHWANRLGLEIKYSETKIGIIAENEVAKILSDLGHSVELTQTRYPYDLLIDGCVKADVKAAHKSYVRGSEIYAYRIAKRQQTCDVYIFCEMDETNIVAIYIVPSNAVAGQVQVDMGTLSTIYEKYRDRFCIIDDIVEFYDSLIAS